MEENVYKEVFERTLRAEDVDYKIAAVLESHPESLGWVHGEPRVEFIFVFRDVLCNIVILVYGLHIPLPVVKEFKHFRMTMNL